MLKKQLQDALLAIDNVISELRARGIPDELVIAALARQLYNRIQQRSSDLPDHDIEDL